MLLQQLRRPRHTDKRIISIRTHSRKNQQAHLIYFPVTAGRFGRASTLRRSSSLMRRVPFKQCVMCVRETPHASAAAEADQPQPYNHSTVIPFLQFFIIFANLTVCNRSASCSRAGYVFYLYRENHNHARKRYRFSDIFFTTPRGNAA